MTDLNGQEFNVPQEIKNCPETAAAPPEMKNTAHDPFALPEEFELPPAYAGKSKEKEEEEKKSGRTSELLKKMLIATAASAVATVGIMSSFGNDPLGRDFLINEEHWHEEYQNEPWDNTDRPYDDQKAIVEPEDPEDGVTFKYAHLTFNSPDGKKNFDTDYGEEEIDYYYAESAPYLWEESYNQMLEWLKEEGGDPDSLKLVKCKISFVKTVKSDDYLAVGDEDDFENQYVISGGKVKVYRKDLYYTAAAAEQTTEPQPYTESVDTRYSDRDSADDTYPPLLENLERNGIEDFIVFESFDGTVEWIYAGSERLPEGTSLASLPGASYDEETNTLTLENFTGGVLNANMMGNSFKLKLVGDNHLDGILVWGFYYGGSLTVIGPGSLTVNENRLLSVGIELRAEESPSCLIIDGDVEKLEVFGGPVSVTDQWQSDVAAIIVRDTTLEKGIYYLEPLRLNAPTHRVLRTTLENASGKTFTFSLAHGFITDELPEGYGDLARHVIFSHTGEKWAPEEEYQDYLDNN
ncbi:MAG: hypothetical protein IJV00_03415 [Clostridia bacterium]|nr:hypothetical protein [Clostridia bacterium]